MPFGFPAYQEQVARYRGVSAKKLLRASEDALDELGWRPQRDGKWRLTATVPMQFYVIFIIYSGKFSIEADDAELFIRSEGAFALEWMDVGQHSANIRKFLDRLDDVLQDID